MSEAGGTLGRMELRPGYREWAPPAALRPAADLLPGAARRLPGDLSPGAALSRLIEMTARLTSERPPDALVSAGARLLAASRERTSELARDLGVSERQFRRRCLDAVGYGPKTLHRVLRFRRFVSRIDAAGGPVDLSRVAAEAGYADQAHLTRESVRLAGLPPAALMRARRA